jgi:DnaA-homolog protein
MWQLALPLGVTADQSFDAFHVNADNALAVAAVQALVSGRSHEPQVLVWGESGVGKTHLLTAACHSASAIGLRVAYLTGEDVNDQEALLGVERCDLLCLDDVQQLSTEAEESLFHAINRCRQTQTRLLFSSNNEPAGLNIKLADLTTRLQWGPRFQLLPLHDDALHDALEQLFMARELTWNEDVVPYMLKRYPRDIAQLRRCVQTLDAASLQAKRRITIPFLKTVLSLDAD